MPTTPATSSGTIVATVILSVLAVLAWAYHLALLNSLTGSDAAGNALGKAFATFSLIVVWTLLAVLAVTGFLSGRMPAAAAIAALILIPASGFASGLVLDLLTRPNTSPFMWPIVIPAAVPPLVIAFSFWVLIPSLHEAIPAASAGGIVWGAIFVLCLSIFPMQQLRERADNQRAAERAQVAVDFASLPADAALPDLTPFLETNAQDQALARIRSLPRLQEQVEAMLERGDFPLVRLRELGLDPTPALCEKAKAELRRRVAPLITQTPGAKPYSAIADEMAGAASAMEWLVGYGCSCDAESLIWEDMAKGYSGSNWDVYRVAGARDPSKLGKVLNEYPEKFSQLTPKAHLKAWLKFAGDQGLRAQALAGARQLDHRTADAVEMLGDEREARTIISYLSELDLEPNSTLCSSALGVLRGDFAKTWRPTNDDPRSYDELLGRLGGESSFSALIWLAQSGCDAETAITEAESLVRAYKDSPDRTAMLATLAQLHRKT
jgi:hypothetical protein